MIKTLQIESATGRSLLSATEPEPMATYSLRIYRRRAPQETVGILSGKIDIEANSPGAAIIEAAHRLDGLDWDRHFAGLSGDGEGFVKFWANEQS